MMERLEKQMEFILEVDKVKKIVRHGVSFQTAPVPQHICQMQAVRRMMQNIRGILH